MSLSLRPIADNESATGDDLLLVCHERGLIHPARTGIKRSEALDLLIKDNQRREQARQDVAEMILPLDIIATVASLVAMNHVFLNLLCTSTNVYDALMSEHSRRYILWYTSTTGQRYALWHTERDKFHSIRDYYRDRHRTWKWHRRTYLLPYDWWHHRAILLKAIRQDRYNKLILCHLGQDPLVWAEAICSQFRRIQSRFFPKCLWEDRTFYLTLIEKLNRNSEELTRLYRLRQGQWPESALMAFMYYLARLKRHRHKTVDSTIPLTPNIAWCLYRHLRDVPGLSIWWSGEVIYTYWVSIKDYIMGMQTSGRVAWYVVNPATITFDTSQVTCSLLHPNPWWTV